MDISSSSSSSSSMLATYPQMMRGHRSTERCCNHASALLAIALASQSLFCTHVLCAQLAPTPLPFTPLHSVAHTLVTYCCCCLHRCIVHTRRPAARTSKGCGTVQFTQRAAALAAQKALHNSNAFERAEAPLVVEPLDPRKQKRPPPGTACIQCSTACC
jgi:hypothetical protein